MHRLAPLLAAGVALALACAAPAAASPTLDVGIADDRALLHASPEEAATAAAAWGRLGIDVVRIHARWGDVAPDPSGRVAPAAPAWNWAKLDRAVALVREHGMRAMLTVTGPGPVWGTQFPVKDNPRYKPDPRRFAEFAAAVAARYAAQVDDYIVWNEPNVPYWLQPQSACTRSGCTPYAPHLYRQLVRAADPAIRAADPGARVLIGALAPRGSSATSTNGQLRPLTFIRSMGCVSRSYARLRSGACRGFAPASGYAFAYHPHGLKLSPTQRSSHGDEAQLADIGRLLYVLDRVSGAGGLKSRGGGGRFPLAFTEYGYQTNPPDKTLGVSPAAQATWLQQAAHIAWRHPRVRSLVQYAWKDEPLGTANAGWQSGLHDVDGQPKPALAGFTRPFWAERLSSRTVRTWGQVRPGGATTVTLERRLGSTWTRVADVATDGRGYFRRDVRTGSTATFRFRHDGAVSSTRTVARG